ncbi:hypothetical protein EV401DRAFT_1142841 [Pisolithus croceorrhizus]|nr:hypothetical protein EV401DRAFT_1142841 [Pisolithus croceorrhizus]
MEVTASNDVLRVAVDAQMIRYMQVALTTLLVYNCVLSWDDEVKYIWKNRFSLISVIYFILRYLGIAYMIFSSAEFVTNTISTDKASVRQVNECRTGLLSKNRISFTPYFPFLSLWINCAILWINQFILQLRLHALRRFKENFTSDGRGLCPGNHNYDCVRDTFHCFRRFDPTSALKSALTLP